MGFEKKPRQGVGVSKVYLHEFGCQILNRVSLKKYLTTIWACLAYMVWIGCVCEERWCLGLTKVHVG